MAKRKTELFGDISLIDIIYSRKADNSVVLVLVTADYLDGSPETQMDLLDKLEGYLKHIQSDEFKKEYPQKNVFIEVELTELPDVLITDLLAKCQNWCVENGATLRVRVGDNYIRFVDDI